MVLTNAKVSMEDLTTDIKLLETTRTLARTESPVFIRTLGSSTTMIERWSDQEALDRLLPGCRIKPSDEIAHSLFIIGWFPKVPLIHKWKKDTISPIKMRSVAIHQNEMKLKQVKRVELTRKEIAQVQKTNTDREEDHQTWMIRRGKALIVSQHWNWGNEVDNILFGIQLENQWEHLSNGMANVRST